MQAAIPGGRVEQRAGKPLYVARLGAGECWVMQTGMGLQQAAAGARALLGREPFVLSISTGFACALTSAHVGDVVAGTQVESVEHQESAGSCRLEAGGLARDRFMTVLRAWMQGGRGVEGLFVSVNRVVGRGGDKAALARRTGAIGLDMESAALAGEATTAGVPFVIVRTVSDLRDEDLPLDFNLFLRPSGWARGIMTIVLHPGCLGGLMRLRRQSLVAARNLSRCLESVLRQFLAELPGGQVPTGL